MAPKAFIMISNIYIFEVAIFCRLIPKYILAISLFEQLNLAHSRLLCMHIGCLLAKVECQAGRGSFFC